MALEFLSMVKSFKLQASGYPDQATSMGREAASYKLGLTRPELWDIEGVCHVLLNPNSKKGDLEDKKF